MTRKIRPVVFGVAAAGVLILAIAPASAGQQAAPVKKVKATLMTMPPEVLRKLTAPTSREVILESIKSLPRPATPLTRAAGTAPPPIKLQMRQGPGKSKPATAVSAAGAARIAATNTGYDKIDWKAGVFISPFTVPRYGQANWPVAMLTTRYVDSMKTQDPGLVELNWPAEARIYCIFDNTINAMLELPEDPALYTITLKVVRSDGMCSASWVQNRTRCGELPLQVYCSGSSVPMTKLIDDSGFVGIVNLAPGPAEDGSPFGMRAYNAYLTINVTTWFSIPEEPLPVPAPLVFAGLIITRL